MPDPVPLPAILADVDDLIARAAAVHSRLTAPKEVRLLGALIEQLRSSRDKAAQAVPEALAELDRLDAHYKERAAAVRVKISAQLERLEKIKAAAAAPKPPPPPPPPPPAPPPVDPGLGDRLRAGLLAHVLGPANGPAAPPPAGKDVWEDWE